MSAIVEITEIVSPVIVNIPAALPGSTYTAGTGITLAGGEFAIDSTVVTLTGTQTLSNKTLTAPVLGTPASGTLTNCTFPTLNQSTSGNAATATALFTARTIFGQSFNGTANIGGGTLSLAGNLTTTGAFNTTFAQLGSVTITLPSSGSPVMARTDAGQTFTGNQTVAGYVTANQFFSSAYNQAYLLMTTADYTNVALVGVDGGASPLLSYQSRGFPHIWQTAYLGAAIMKLSVAGGLSIGNTVDYGAGGLGITGKLVVVTSTTPASATAAGVAGTIAWDSSYIYVCTATNTWKRTAIAAW